LIHHIALIFVVKWIAFKRVKQGKISQKQQTNVMPGVKFEYP